jgi:hypothetical protein
VLAYPKFKLTPGEQHDLLADYLPWAEIFRVPDPPPRAPACRDPHDLPFLQLAPLRGLAIITPAQAIGRLSS